MYSPATCIVTLRREHDIASRLGVEQALALAASHRFTLVDLSRCTFLDASVIGALLLAASAARRRDGALELIVPPGAQAVRRTLEVAGAPAVLPFHSTRTEAIASVESASRLRSHKQVGQGLRRVSARIEELQAKTEESRARRGVRVGQVTVVRAQVAPEGAPLAWPIDRSLPIGPA